MTEGKFYLDSHGYPRAEYESPTEVLGWYLEQDVQNSPATCDGLLGVCEEIVDGRRQDWQGTGNAYTVSIADRRVTIENEFAEPAQACVISIEEFKTAVMAWKDLLRSVPR